MSKHSHSENHSWVLPVKPNDLLLFIGGSKEPVDLPMQAEQIEAARTHEESLAIDNNRINVISKFDIFLSENLYRSISLKIKENLIVPLEGEIAIYPKHLRLMEGSGSHFIEPRTDNFATLVLFLPYTDEANFRPQEDLSVEFQLSTAAVCPIFAKPGAKLAVILSVHASQ